MAFYKCLIIINLVLLKIMDIQNGIPSVKNAPFMTLKTSQIIIVYSKKGYTLHSILYHTEDAKCLNHYRLFLQPLRVCEPLFASVSI